MAILKDYLAKQNRPYSITDIMTNLHNSIPKAVMLKALAQLEEASVITAKTYGKSIIYVIRQTGVLTEDISNHEEADMEGMIKGLQEQVIASSARLKAMREREKS